MYFVSAPSVRRFEPVKRKVPRKTKLAEFSSDEELFQSFILADDDEEYVQQLQF